MEITATTRPSDKAARQIVRDLKQALDTGICLTMTYWRHSRDGHSEDYSIFEVSTKAFHKFQTWHDLILFYFDIMENS